ncbi:hypothetical protein L1987_75211 [Smallanthus sonchifolius]|uniref:Uncharacterized protein n=1 Tax=Smallanthus sonchifolius TaxID=185202 RepID=A0ACB9A623_9ASTR|nr:hypothetical protein L1987_75211 [Smallanthus sonchifolius]
MHHPLTVPKKETLFYQTRIYQYSQKCHYQTLPQRKLKHVVDDIFAMLLGSFLSTPSLSLSRFYSYISSYHFNSTLHSTLSINHTHTHIYLHVVKYGRQQGQID